MLRLAATSIGPIAAEILAEGHDVEVLAVFERSFYLLAHNGLVCVGAEGIGRGPINVILHDAGAVSWQNAGILAEVKGHALADRLVIGEHFTASLIAAERWQPPAWTPFDPATADRGLAALRALALQRMPEAGLAPLVFAADGKGPRTPATRAAASQVHVLQARLPRALSAGAIDAESLRALTLLLGLGPGLTPSGDDLIGGMMLALTALGHADLRDALWHGLAPELDDLTTEISAMHLSAAADGLGAEAVHLLANVLLAGDTRALPGQLDGVARIGHCSGWDTLAGFVLTIAAAVGNGT